MKNFNEIYEEVYKESNEELETLRKSRARRAIIIVAISLAVVILILTILTKYEITSMLPFTMPFFVIIVIILVMLSKGKYTPAFKEKVIAPFIKNTDENLNYYPNQGISPFIYRQGEFEMYDRYHTEDLIEGTLDGKYKLQMAEVHTEEETTDKDGNTHTYTLFHGLFGSVECSKNIGTRLKVHSDKGALGRLFKGKQRIEMDSAEFEKYFDVFGDNKITAMQILTSDVMAMMIDFREQSKIKYEITIKDKQIYIRFHTGGVFEPKLFKNALDYKMLKKYYDIIDFVFKVTRELNKAIEKAEI